MLDFSQLTDIQIIALVRVMDKLFYKNEFGIHASRPNKQYQQFQIAINAERIARDLHQIRLLDETLRAAKTSTQNETKEEKEKRKDREYNKSIRLAAIQDRKDRVLAVQLSDLERIQHFNAIEQQLTKKLNMLTEKYS